MNALEAILIRKSTRAYNSEQIPNEALDNILKAACASPVGMARYDTLHITVIQNEDVLVRIFNEAEEALFKAIGIRKNMNFGAKTVILVSSAPAYREGVEYAHAGIVIEKQDETTAIKFSLNEIELDDVLIYLINTYHVKDFKIEDISIEDITKKLYEKH